MPERHVPAGAGTDMAGSIGWRGDEPISLLQACGNFTKESVDEVGRRSKDGLEVLAMDDQQFTGTGRCRRCRPLPAGGQERQLAEYVTGAERGECDIAIFGRHRYLYAPGDHDKHLVAE